MTGDLPAAVPTKAVITALDHVLEHTHPRGDGLLIRARDHFLGVLKEEIGLAERQPEAQHADGR